MAKKDWNPELYMKYGKERTQPSIDLVSRIEKQNPERIIDIGCGPGNSTRVLYQQWPGAQITGADSSPAMIEAAGKYLPKLDWLLMDAGKDEFEEKFDIIFSNATIQWIPDHARLLRKFHNALKEEGVIAIQVPLFWDMPIGIAIAETAKDKRWAGHTEGATDLFIIHDYSWYYDHLTELYSSVEIWETYYMHVMDSQQAIMEMIRSTGLKPYFERLNNAEEQKIFEEIVFKSVVKDYPVQKDGKVLFPFKRLFFIAEK